MKKFYLLVVGVFLFFNVYAAENLNEITIEYQNNSITTSTRSYTNDRYIFQIDYIGDITNLSNEQLNYILKQKSNDYLKVFGDLKVTINPDNTGKFRNINNNVFVGYSGGMFGNSLNEDVMPNDTASLENLTFKIKNPIMDVYYRKNENEAWTNDKSSLNGKLTIEEQLSNLLNIDINLVKDKYKTLYYFKPYEDSIYTNRFDFYESTEQTTVSDENNYEVTTLKKLNQEYALLKFDYPTTNVFYEANRPINKLPYIITLTILICLTSFYILRKKRII